MKKYFLEFLIFITGAVIMIYEMLGSRILGPYFGTSVFVWTSIIGVVMFSLSIGYFFGGRLADKRNDYDILSYIILLSAFTLWIAFLSKDNVLLYFQENVRSIKTSSLMASFILFLPSNLLFGMVYPFIAKIKLDDINKSGSIFGNLYALSTLGSICGTFLAGFFLIPYFGIDMLLVVVISVLILISILLSYKHRIKLKIFFMTAVVLMIIVLHIDQKIREKDFAYIEENTFYNRIIIRNNIYRNDRKIKNLHINNENSSAMYLDNPNELVYEYTKYYDLVNHFNPDFENAVMFGGAGYSYPKYFLSTYKDKNIDVVEIDPEPTEIAKKYFYLEENPRMNIFHQDARVFLNTTKNKYDVIFGDAFSSHYYIPFQLTTKEAIKKQYDILTNSGVVILNIISAIDGEKSGFLRSEYKTYKTIFPYVYLFKTTDIPNELTQNVILVASKNTSNFEDKDDRIDAFLKNKIEDFGPIDLPIFTDDFAPVEKYVNKNIYD